GTATRAYGFLTAVESAAHGVFGGYLLVDPWGRPLEFHCTAPVKVSRAQQILFGSTLQSHLHGQQIGGTLLTEATVTPEVVLTDLEPMLHVRSHTHLPVALVRGGSAAATATLAAVPGGGLGGSTFSLGEAQVSPHASDAGREAELRERLEELAAAVDLREPFDRIRAAIDEAQRH
ncbi:MAG: hypothetical protein ACKOHK_04885, partial [Planctomycetia bacterium]